jgi:beta-lactam-binding protein with PASTA domain
MMKKGFGKGFCSGILVAALTVGLGVSAMAASRTITVDDNIRITLNGAVFSPKDAKGRDVPLFSYNGTTYAPVRAICEAAGLKVDFDSANYTAVLTTPDRYIASTPSASNYISVDKAKEIALNHAGVKAADAIFWTGTTAAPSTRWNSTPGTRSTITASTPRQAPFAPMTMTGMISPCGIPETTPPTLPPLAPPPTI